MHRVPLPPPSRLLSTVVILGLLGTLALAPPALGEMYKYTDSKGRLHFTQDIGQVPPEYRDQVERKVLEREISVTGSGGQETRDQRTAIEKRSRQLGAHAQARRRRAVKVQSASPRPPANALTGAPEPEKYRRDCSNYTANHRCRNYVTGAWRAWDAANGGNNGKPVTRRRVGK
jgi:hypothetical protein